MTQRNDRFRMGLTVYLYGVGAFDLILLCNAGVLGLDLMMYGLPSSGVDRLGFLAAKEIFLVVMGLSALAGQLLTAIGLWIAGECSPAVLGGGLRVAATLQVFASVAMIFLVAAASQLLPEMKDSMLAFFVAMLVLTVASWFFVLNFLKRMALHIRQPEMAQVCGRYLHRGRNLDLPAAYVCYVLFRRQLPRSVDERARLG